MRHDRAQRRMSRYLEDDLGAGERLKLERHLEGCEACTEELRALQRTLDLLHDLPQPEAPGDIAGAVLRQIAADKTAPGWNTRLAAWFQGFASDSWLGPVAAAATLVAVVYVSASAVLPLLGGDPAAVDRPVVVAQTETPVPPVRRSDPVEVQGLRVVNSGAARGASLPAMAPSRSSALVESCRAEGRSDAYCARFQAWRLIGLGLEDTDLFVREMETVPAPERERLMHNLRTFAHSSGAAPFLAEHLRRQSRARTTSLAVRFEGSPRY